MCLKFLTLKPLHAPHMVHAHLSIREPELYVPSSALRNAQVITSLLAYEEPDFVALSGDMVSGFGWDGRKGWFEERYSPFLTACLRDAKGIYLPAEAALARTACQVSLLASAC